MEYDIYKSSFCGMNGAHDPIGMRQDSWGKYDFGGYMDFNSINNIFRKAEKYNVSRAKMCSCRVEVKEVK